jgi:hypothetical protein
LTRSRIHNQASVLSSDGNDADLASGQNSTVQGRLDVQKRILSKWALQWKSIIRSSIGNGKTAYPYCLYIRSLDLRNLKYLLEETRFREVAFDDFFSDEMQKFLNAQETPIKKTRGSKASQMRLNIPAILDSVGESITSFVSESASQSHGTVVLEDLSGHISALALPKWTSMCIFPSSHLSYTEVFLALLMPSESWDIQVQMPKCPWEIQVQMSKYS